MLEIIQGGSEDPFKTVRLDRESRKYIHIRINNYVVRYDMYGDQAGETVTNYYYDVTPCYPEMFNTTFEKDYI